MGRMILIDRQAAINAAIEAVDSWDGSSNIGRSKRIHNYIMAVQVPLGHWTDKGSLSCRCSECGCKSPKEYPYCPNCGMPMEK